MYDELQLDTLGDKKTALFLIMSDTDSTFNFLISMVYTQLFNLLCDKADDVYGGKLPIHVRCLIDECANIGQIPNLEKLVATIRSREISACLVLQARSQLKAIYKDNADTIVGNMDSQIFLGGSEPTTLKDLSEMLGKETIDAFNTSDTRGNSPSYGTNYQQQAAAQIEVEKPFPQEEELAEKSARLAELNAQLDVDEKSHDPEQDEEEQEDAPRRPSVLAALEEKSDKSEPVKPFRSYYDKDGDAR